MRAATRIDAQAERTAGRCLWTHRGEHRAVCHISYSPALRMGIINGRELRVAPQFEFPLWVEMRHSRLRGPPALAAGNGAAHRVTLAGGECPSATWCPCPLVSRIRDFV